MWDRDAWLEYVAWQAEAAKVVARINGLIGDYLRDPFRGMGKPEPLKQNLSGCWSRRINQGHRLVYRVAGSGKDQTLQVAQCRYHY